MVVKSLARGNSSKANPQDQVPSFCQNGPVTISLLLVQQIVAMFLMLLVGYFIVRLKVLSAADARPLSLIVLYVVAPCTIVNAFQVTLDPQTLSGLLVGFALAIAANVLLVLFPLAVRHPLKLTIVEQLTVSYPNSGNLILPIVIAVLGPQWAIYALPFMVVQIVFLWTHGITMIRRDSKFDLRKILSGVNMLAFYLGLALFLLQIKLPGILGTAVADLGACIAPLSMIVIGMAIGETNVGQIFRVPRYYLVCFLRLVVIPVFVLILYKVTGLPHMSALMPSICLVLLLAVSSSQAATIAQLAQTTPDDGPKAAALNVMTVLFLVVTMPLNVIAYQTLVL